MKIVFSLLVTGLAVFCLLQGCASPEVHRMSAEVTAADRARDKADNANRDRQKAEHDHALGRNTEADLNKAREDAKKADEAAGR